MRLDELRREPSKNVKQTTKANLMKHAKAGNTSVSFSPINKIGIHPKSNWNTPNGVYAYQLKDFRSEILHTKPEFVTSVFPYGEERPFIFILRSTYTNPLVMSSTIKESSFDNYVNFLIKNTNLKKQVVDLALEDAEKFETNAQQLIDILKSLCTYSYGGKKATNMMNKFLRTFGYDAVIDDGTGTLFDDTEPYQIVYLTPSAYKIIDSFHNDNMDRRSRHEVYGRGGREKKDDIKVGDLVIITDGENEYDTGKILRLYPETRTAEIQLADGGKIIKEPYINFQLQIF